MARKKKKNTHKPLGLILVLLILIFIFMLLLFLRSQSSLLFLSNTAVQTVDKTLSHLPDQRIKLHIEQMNYDGKKPYKYVYKKIIWPGSIKPLKQKWEQDLKRIPFVQIQFWKEEQFSSQTVYTVKIGTSKLTFYQLTLLVPKQNQLYTETEPNYADYTPKQSVMSAKTGSGKKKTEIALVIDDVGAEPLSLTKQFMKFPEKITFAVFPLLNTTRDRAERIHKHPNFSIIVHQPMEPMRYKERHIQLQNGVLLTNMSKEEIISTLQKSIASVPYAVGMNNHQGSAGTSSKRMMDIVLHYLLVRNFFFLDSYTTAQSVAYKEADKIGIPYNKRDVFLDNIDTEEAVQKQFDRLVKTALKNGKAVGIGHMTKRSTINVLLKNVDRVKKENIEFVFIKDMLYRKRAIQ